MTAEYIRNTENNANNMLAEKTIDCNLKWHVLIAVAKFCTSVLTLSKLCS